VLLLVGAISPRSDAVLVWMLSGVALAISAGLAAIGPLGTAFSGGFVADQASVFAKVAIYLMSAVALFLGSGWLGRLHARQFEYPILVLLAALGMG